jgi:hypothetical protein
VTTAGFSGIHLTVRPDSARQTRRLLRRFHARYRVARSRGRVEFLVRNPGGSESRLALRLGAKLHRSRIAVVALVVR